MTGRGVRVIPVGAHAFLVELADAGEVRWARARIAELATSQGGGLGAPRDVVPAARTVLVDGVEHPAAWMAALAGLEPGVEPIDGGGRSVVMRVVYDGPDLDLVARAWRCGVADVVERHSGAVFTVDFCGFAPGFAYCTADPPLPATPRRPNPRPRLRAGAVAVADSYTAVYPRAMPGGWQVIGHTDAVVFDVDRDQPALLRPGDTVRFEAVG